MPLFINGFLMFRFLDITHDVQCKQNLKCKIFGIVSDKGNTSLVYLREKFPYDKRRVSVRLTPFKRESITYPYGR